MSPGDKLKGKLREKRLCIHTHQKHTQQSFQCHQPQRPDHLPLSLVLCFDPAHNEDGYKDDNQEGGILPSPISFFSFFTHVPVVEKKGSLILMQVFQLHSVLTRLFLVLDSCKNEYIEHYKYKYLNIYRGSECLTTQRGYISIFHLLSALMYKGKMDMRKMFHRILGSLANSLPFLL